MDRERCNNRYGVATISRLLKIISLLCRISSLLNGSVAKETNNFKEPTNRSHPIAQCVSSPPLFVQLVGSLKFYVSFAKEPYKTDCILQKRPMISP